MTPPVPLRLDAAAAPIGRDPASLKAAAHRGDVDCFRIGDDVRFHRGELQRWSQRGADRSPVPKVTPAAHVPRPVEQPEDTPAALVRRSLAESRAEGLSFARAWEEAMQLVAPADRPVRLTRAVQNADDWRLALIASKAAFRRAYTGAEPTPGERAAIALADAFP